MQDDMETNKAGKDEAQTSSDYEYNTLMRLLGVSVSKHLLDEHFTLIWANDFYYQLIGWSKEEYEEIFHNQCDLYYQNDKAEWDRLSATVIEAINARRNGYSLVSPIRRRNGEYVWVQFSTAFSEEYVNGYRVAYTSLTNIDDLIRIQKEQAVTYDNLPGFVAKFRPEEEGAWILEANDRFHEFFGCGGQERLACGLSNLDTEKNRASYRQNLPLMQKGEHVHFTIQARNPSGGNMWLQVNADCIEWVNGVPIYLVIYIDITDITEQRELQKQLEERSEMLRSALDLAEKANQAKSDFLSRMSHDIRTPMNAIMGMISIAKESLDDPRHIADCLDKVETSARFLLMLINDILDMSKIESGKMVLKKKKINFAELVREITAMFYDQTKKKQVRFKVSVMCGMDETYGGDELKLKQIIINLLGNAVKFTGAGGQIDLFISEGKKAERSVELIFSVKDTGAGMEQEVLEKIFQPFEQGSRQRQNFGGSGLGLAIAQNYAHLMNGNIEVNSAPGEGSIFTVHVWLDILEDRAENNFKKRFQDKKALVLDKDQRVAGCAARQLTRFGAQAQWALDGQEALKLLEKERQNGYNLLLADWETLGEDGLEFIHRLRRQYTKEKLLIAVVAYDWSGFQKEAVQAGADEFLDKPLFPSTLYDFLMKLTQNVPLKVESRAEESFAGERILLAEDNDINLEIAQTLLESRNLQVDAARNGVQAVERFQSRPRGYYYAILMDIQMPEMNGLEAAKKIRGLPRSDAAEIPIIAMTANAFEDDIEKSMEAGMNGHISKPVDIPRLFQVLRQLKDKE